MLTAEARIETDRPGRYLTQICQHLSNQGRHPTRWSEASAVRRLRVTTNPGGHPGLLVRIYQITVMHLPFLGITPQTISSSDDMSLP